MTPNIWIQPTAANTYVRHNVKPPRRAQLQRLFGDNTPHITLDGYDPMTKTRVYRINTMPDNARETFLLYRPAMDGEKPMLNRTSFSPLDGAF